MANHADRVLETIQTWLDNYGDVLSLVWGRFETDAEWPDAARLTREQFSTQPRRDYVEIARNMPPQLGRLDLSAPCHQIVLTPRALTFVPGARSLLDSFATLVQIGVGRYRNPEGEAVILAAELQELLRIEERGARQLEQLVIQDQWFFRLNGGQPGSGNLRIAVDERVVFCVAEVETIDDYFEAQLKAWYPDPVGSSNTQVGVGEVLRRSDETTLDSRRVMVVHGRDLQARNDLFALLRALGLSPIEWNDAVRATGIGTPYTGEAVEAAFGIAQAAVVLCTPDEQVLLREDLRKPADLSEARPAWQPRPNVYFEGGIAFTSHPTRTIVLELGPVRVASDLLGRNVIRIGSGPKWRHEFAERLRNADCPVDTKGTDWLEVGQFHVPTLTGLTGDPPGPTESASAAVRSAPITGGIATTQW